MRYISDRIAVLYLGRLQELGPADVVFDGPHHPYTEALLSAVPTIDGGGRDRIRLEGDIPSAASPPSGCVFHTRCPRKLGAICEESEPPLVEVEDGARDALPHPDRGAASGCRQGDASHAREDPRRRAGEDGRAARPSCELELAPPGPEEVLVRLHASGVCHSDYNAIDGTVGDALPGRARARGRGRGRGESGAA